MKVLLDVNVLVALLLAVHSHHKRARAWMLRLGRGDTVLLTPWVELAFLRVGLQSRLLPDLATGQLLLAGFRPGAARLDFLADDARADSLPDWVGSAAAIGDGHLSSLASAHGATLVTFDQDIPGALVIP